MNIINVDISFEKQTCITTGNTLITGDYNSTKLIFNFDKLEGRKVFEMISPDNKLVFSDEIQNNEVILTRNDAENNSCSIFNKEGYYTFEVSLYGENSKLTSMYGRLYVEKEKVNIDGELVEVYLPIFDKLLKNVENSLKEMESAKEKVVIANEEAKNIINDFNNNVDDTINKINKIHDDTAVIVIDIDNKLTEYNKNASEKLSVYNTNASEKLSFYNTNVANHIKTFNDNAKDKLDLYNQNDTTKTAAFNDNATNKTTAFNSNANSKTETYNNNHNEKLNTYNTNVANKTTEFNTNANTKIEEFNSVVTNLIVVPELRNGSVGNPYNSNAVAMRYVIPTNGAKVLRIKLNVDLPENYYYHIMAKTYNTSGIISNNASYQIKEYDPLFTGTDNYYYFHIPDGVKGFACGLSEKNNDGDYNPLRITSLNSNAIEITYIYSDVDTEKLLITPALRNGSVGNAANANAVAMRYVIPTNGAKVLRIKLNVDLPENYYYHIMAKTYNTSGIISNNASYQIKEYDPLFTGTDNYYYFHIPDGVKGFACGLSEKNNDGDYNPLRITSLNSNAIEITYIYSDVDTLELKNMVYPYLYDKYDNLFDGYLEDGSIDTTTGMNTGNVAFKRTDFIRVKQGKFYYDIYSGYINDLNHGFVRVYYYDENKNLVSTHNYTKSKGTYSENASPGSTLYFKAPRDGYARYICNKSQGENGKLCIIESDTEITKMSDMPSYSENLNIGHKEVRERFKDIDKKIEEINNTLNTPKYSPTDYAVQGGKELETTLISLQKAQPKSLSFSFITDLHFINGTESETILKNIGGVIKNISKNVSLPFNFFGGDNIAERSTHDLQIANADAFKDIINSYDISYGVAKGNHDDSSISGYDSTAGKYKVGYNISDLEYYYRLFKHNENIFNVKMDKNRDKLYYYVDFPSQQIRVICLNCIDIPYLDDGNGYLKYDGQHQYGYSNEQLNWVINKALNFDNVDNHDDWGVITIQHISDASGTSFNNDIVQEEHNGNVMLNIFKAFKNRTSYSFSRTDSDFNCDVSCDFTNAKQELICRISGHTHADKYEVIDDIIYISTMQSGTNGVGNGTASDGNIYTKTSGTVEETSFDIFTIDKDSRKIFTTRYGAGVDREFTY